MLFVRKDPRTGPKLVHWLGLIPVQSFFGPSPFSRKHSERHFGLVRAGFWSNTAISVFRSRTVRSSLTQFLVREKLSQPSGWLKSNQSIIRLFFSDWRIIFANRKRSFIYKYNGYFIPKRNKSPTHLKYKMPIFGILFWNFDFRSTSG